VKEEKACPTTEEKGSLNPWRSPAAPAPTTAAATEPAFHDLTILQPYFPPVSAFPSPLPSPMLWMDQILMFSR
jgi:hypothetical protein